MYGLAFSYMELGDIEQAQKHFQMVLDMPVPEDLRALAKNGLREIAVRELKARGPRMDAGQYGLDINDPKETHVPRSLPGMDLGSGPGEQRMANRAMDVQ